GNRIDGDGCESNCTLPRCGNLIVDQTEQCDDGNTIQGDGCENDCTLPRCGNSILDSGEQCDDGNLVDGDGCESNCTRTPTCVDGIQNGAETGVDCGGTCPTPCIIIAFPLRGSQEVPDSLSVGRGECTIDISGSRSSFTMTCTHNLPDGTTAEIDTGA